MLRFFLILFAVLLGSSPLHSQITRPIVRGDDAPGPLFVQEPYCELGYGSCRGACSEEGKKAWDCPADALPCYHSSQHCTCETADMCKPKKKKSELSYPPARWPHGLWLSKAPATQDDSVPPTPQSAAGARNLR
jgi:hypothetical protein